MPATTVRLAAQDEKQHAEQSPVRKPTARQVYCAAHLMADALGVSWPTNRREASDLIGKLRDLAVAHDAAPEPATDAGMPF